MTDTMTESPASDATPAPNPNANRSTTPVSDAFSDYIRSGWAERPDVAPAPREQAAFAAARRLRSRGLHPRASGSSSRPARRSAARTTPTTLPRALRVLASDRMGRRTPCPAACSCSSRRRAATTRPCTSPRRAGRDSDEFYANAAIGEFWTGPRPSLAHVAADLGPATPARSPNWTLCWATARSTSVVLREADRERRRRPLDAAADALAEDGPLDTDSQTSTPGWSATSASCDWSRTRTRSTRCARRSTRPERASTT